MLSAEQKPNKLNAIARKRDFQMIMGVEGGCIILLQNQTKLADNE
jgi:hypothetical protein